MFDLTFLAATGYVAFGVMLGALAEERIWWLLHRPLPRPRRRRKVRPAARYVQPGRWGGGRWDPPGQFERVP